MTELPAEKSPEKSSKVEPEDARASMIDDLHSTIEKQFASEKPKVPEPQHLEIPSLMAPATQFHRTTAVTQTNDITTVVEANGRGASVTTSPNGTSRFKFFDPATISLDGALTHDSFNLNGQGKNLGFSSWLDLNKQSFELHNKAGLNAWIEHGHDSLKLGSTIPELGQFLLKEKKDSTGFYADTLFGDLQLERGKDSTNFDLGRQGFGAIDLSQKRDDFRAGLSFVEMGSLSFRKTRDQSAFGISSRFGAMDFESGNDILKSKLAIDSIGTFDFNRTHNGFGSSGVMADLGSYKFNHERGHEYGLLKLDQIGSFDFNHTRQSRSANLSLNDIGSFGYKADGQTLSLNGALQDFGELDYYQNKDLHRFSAHNDQTAFKASVSNTNISTSLSNKELGSVSVETSPEKIAVAANHDQTSIVANASRASFDVKASQQGVGTVEIKQPKEGSFDAQVKSDKYGSIEFANTPTTSVTSFSDTRFGSAFHVTATDRGAKVVVDKLPDVKAATVEGEIQPAGISYKGAASFTEASLKIEAPVGQSTIRAGARQTYSAIGLINGNRKQFVQAVSRPSLDASVELPHGTVAQVSVAPTPGTKTSEYTPHIQVERKGSIANGAQLDLNLDYKPTIGQLSYKVEAGRARELGANVNSGLSTRPHPMLRWGFSATGNQDEQKRFSGELGARIQIDY